MTLTVDQVACMASIYDAVLYPELRPQMLDRLAYSAGAKAATLFALDRREDVPHINAVSSFYNAEIISEYMEKYGDVDRQGFQRFFGFSALDWLTDEQVYGVPIAQLYASSWLREHYGIHRRSGVRLNESQIWIDGLALHFGANRGTIDAAEEDFLRPVLPHLARLIEIDRPLDALRRRYNAVISVLDRLRIGVLIAVPNGEVVLRNQEADRILDLQDGLSLGRDQRLRARNGDDARTLDTALVSASTTAAGEGDDSGARLVLGRTSGADGFIVEVTALRNARDELEPGLRGALVFLIDPDHRAPVRSDGVRELFALTQAETHVLNSVLEGLSAREIADARSTSVTTVRTQLRNLACKTRTRNRAELVRLALSVNPPVDPAGPNAAGRP